MRSFASDNNSGAHPRILEALARANAGHAQAYGDDPWTREAEALLRREFGDAARSFFVFGGTGANVTGLAALCRPHQAVICAQSAHINVDECGAPERFAGVKLLTLPHDQGKLSPEAVSTWLHGFGNQHHVQPRALSITQATELGAVYTPAETRALADLAHAHGLVLHLDGARLANAAAALGCSLAALTTHAGVDLLSLGGTKNGLVFGEAVVFLSPDLARDYEYVRKQGMQLPSKARFIAAQFSELLRDGLWRENALRANSMARALASAVRGAGAELVGEVQSNAVFVRFPMACAERLRRDWCFYTWDEAASLHRLMCSFDTTAEDVAAFSADLSRALAA